MSQKRKNQRANHTAQEQKQGEKVVWYIIGALAVMGLAYAIYTITLF